MDFAWFLLIYEYGKPSVIDKYCTMLLKEESAFLANTCSIFTVFLLYAISVVLIPQLLSSLRTSWY